MGERSTALVLGGTEFVGLHLVERLVEEGWEVTLFNRGVTAPDLFGSLERLVGDRGGDVSALAGRTWDVVYDVSGFHPDHVDRAAAHLAGACEHYVFVSTVSVYESFHEPGIDEESPLSTIGGPVPEEADYSNYGPMKALCEQRVAQTYPSHAIIRPSIIAGPHDPTSRFTYWAVRLSEPGAHVVPSNRDAPVQYIDARDLAEWFVLIGAERIRGIYNAAVEPLRFDEFLDRVAEATGNPLRPVRLSAKQAEEEGIQPWADLPLWIPSDYESMRGMLQVDASRARAAGLRVRPLEETARDTLAWAAEQGGTEPRVGLAREREAEIVAGREADRTA